ncbi:ABC transporter permease [Sinorhizobium meliloti]|uniref:ABC transporter permease n=1 Tax=Rhizobium meliloti TaxID=382 RepID=UPI003D65F719
MQTSSNPATLIEHEPTSLRQDAWRRLRANRLALVGAIFVALLTLVAIAGPWLSSYDFLSQDPNALSAPPSWAHWLGTDELGRDVLARIIYGARTALIVAVAVTFLAVLIGVTLGAWAGYRGGRADSAISWLIDVTMSVPGLLLVAVINTSLKPPMVAWFGAMYQQTLNPFFRNTNLIDMLLIVASMALITWPPYARLVRAQIITIRSRTYVTAAKSIGLKSRDIILRHILPNAIGPVVVAVSAGLGTAMVLESAFSFLGIGINPPTPSWGNMIADGLRVWRNDPHLLAAPAAVLAISTIAFSFLGDGLNDALNPKRGEN